MADIFISYAREDRERARELAEALTGRGWSVWWDREMRVGGSFADVIETELATARAVIVLWSEHSVKSQWVRNEAREGAARNVLVPVLLDGSRMPLEFRHLHTAGVQEIEDIMSSVAALVSSTGEPRVVPTPPVAVADRTRFKRAGYIGIAAIVIALIVIAIALKPKKPPDVVSVPTDTVQTTQPPLATDTKVADPPPTQTDTDLPPDRLPYGARAVGILMASGRAQCTAFLISNDVAVTASHCVKDKPRPLVLRFGYIDEDARTRDYAVERVLVQNESEAVLRLSGSPGRTFASISNRSRAARVGDEATLLHHDEGKPLRVSKCKVVAVRADELQYRCPTRSGASGGPLLAGNGALLGFHSGSVSRADPDLKKGIPTSVFIGSIRPYWGFAVRPSG